jgi:hypothetical protein
MGENTQKKKMYTAYMHALGWDCVFFSVYMCVRLQEIYIFFST